MLDHFLTKLKAEIFIYGVVAVFCRNCAKDTVAALPTVTKEMKHAEREAWDISTLVKVLGDRAKVLS